MNILVTGGAGFIGRWVVKRLAEDNHKVWILDNLSNSSIDNIKDIQKQYPSITFIKGDIKDTQILESIFSNDFDICYHLAASINVQDSIDDPKTTFENDVTGTFNVLQQCKLKWTKFVYMSTCMVYSAASTESAISEDHPTCPASPYAAAKLAGEQLALSFYHAYGLPVTVLRPFNTYGPYQKQNSEGGVISIFINKKLNNETLSIYGDGTQTRDFLYVTDCADFVVEAGYSRRTNGKVINAGSGRDISITDLAKLIADGSENIKYATHIHPQSEIQKLLCDSRYSRRLLGWRPKVSLSQGIARTEEFLKKKSSLEDISEESSFRFVVMADSSRPAVAVNSEVLRNLLSHVKALAPQPQFILFVGDMVYGGSKVSEQLETWKTLVQDYYPITKFYTALGSHENNENAFSSAFPYLPKEELHGYQQTVYFFDYANTRFIVLNSNRVNSKGSYFIDTKQLAWLESTLKNSNKKYNFVLFHVPAFPSGAHYGESLDMSPEDRNALWKIIDRYDVTAVFVGHEHNYCRRLIDKTLNIKDLTIINSIYQITTGGAGSSLNAHISNIENVMVGPLAVYHYCVLDISNQGVSLQVYDKDNTLIDSCSIYPRTLGPASSTSTDILIPMGASWKYLDNGSDQGTSWRELDFDDSTWASGLAELGYGDGGEATVISYGPNVHKKYITTYFRKHFTVDDASIYESLILRIQRDDGAVVYLNGSEVFRTNMPAGIIDYKTLASKAIDGVEEVSYQKTTIDADILRNGDNIIAVEIHQASSSSSDVSFNFQLLGDKNKQL